MSLTESRRIVEPKSPCMLAKPGPENHLHRPHWRSRVNPSVDYCRSSGASNCGFICAAQEWLAPGRYSSQRRKARQPFICRFMSRGSANRYFRNTKVCICHANSAGSDCSCLAKIEVHGPTFSSARSHSERSAAEFSPNSNRMLSGRFASRSHKRRDLPLPGVSLNVCRGQRAQN